MKPTEVPPGARPVDNNRPATRRQVTPTEDVRYFTTESGERRVDRRRSGDRRRRGRDRRQLNAASRGRGSDRRRGMDRRRSQRPAAPKPPPRPTTGRRGGNVDEFA